MRIVYIVPEIYGWLLKSSLSSKVPKSKQPGNGQGKGYVFLQKAIEDPLFPTKLKLNQHLRGFQTKRYSRRDTRINNEHVCFCYYNEECRYAYKIIEN